MKVGFFYQIWHTSQTAIFESLKQFRSVYPDNNLVLLITCVKKNKVEEYDNNFSNITVTGATVITGFNNTDGSGSSCSKTITGNTFNNWTGGTSTITGMTFGYWGGGTTNSLSNKIIFL